MNMYISDWAVASQNSTHESDAVGVKVTSDGASVGLWCASSPTVCLTGPATKVMDRDFDVGSPYWIVGSGWTVENGKATHSSGTASIQQLNAVHVGSYYDVYVSISGATAGSVTVSLGTAAGTALSSSGWSHTYTAAAGGSTLTITPTADFNGSVDSITVFLHTGPLAANVWHPISSRGVGTVTAGSVYIGWTFLSR